MEVELLFSDLEPGSCFDVGGRNVHTTVLVVEHSRTILQRQDLATWDSI
jgi:hypothetical protein